MMRSQKLVFATVITALVSTKIGWATSPSNVTLEHASGIGFSRLLEGLALALYLPDGVSEKNLRDLFGQLSPLYRW